MKSESSSLLKELPFTTLEKTESQTDWVTCPICKEEWTKLRPCTYLGEEGKQVANYVCITCAEDVRNLHKINDRYPILGVDIKVNLRKSYQRFNKKQFEPKRSAYVASVDYSGWIFQIEPQGKPPYFIVSNNQEAEELRYFDNILQVWSWIRRELENPKP